jgi:hypothetical protein
MVIIYFWTQRLISCMIKMDKTGRDGAASETTNRRCRPS